MADLPSHAEMVDRRRDATGGAGDSSVSWPRSSAIEHCRLFQSKVVLCLTAATFRTALRTAATRVPPQTWSTHMRLQWRDGMPAQTAPGRGPASVPVELDTAARAAPAEAAAPRAGVAQAPDRRAGDQSRRRDHRLRPAGRRGQRPGHAQPHPGDRDHRDRPVHQRQGRGRRGRDRGRVRRRAHRPPPPADPGHRAGVRQRPLRRAGDRARRPAAGTVERLASRSRCAPRRRRRRPRRAIRRRPAARRPAPTSPADVGGRRPWSRGRARAAAATSPCSSTRAAASAGVSQTGLALALLGPVVEPVVDREREHVDPAGARSGRPAAA